MIRAHGVHARHGETRVLDGVDLAVDKGEVAVVIGPSGSGKTSLLRCLNGLAPFHQGTIEIAGLQLSRDVARDAASLRVVRRKVGMVFQGFHLFAHLDLIGNLTLAPRVVDGEPLPDAAERARALLARMGLDGLERRFPRELSGGQQQRAAIARALLMRPEVLLFDEPTSALDAASSREVLSVIGELAAQGQTMVVVTHDLDFARSVATRVHVLSAGREVERGAPSKVLDAPEHAVTRSLTEA